ncbi:isopentenyl transferase family protein [Streptomyces sp. NBC_01262]|uniref:isopentenyl transferase family protein n=1 Tax=Streptomyces sp. NBC_01262 TaxID=2903803 RepID=UPI003FCD7E8E
MRRDRAWRWRARDVICSDRLRRRCCSSLLAASGRPVPAELSTTDRAISLATRLF